MSDHYMIPGFPKAVSETIQVPNMAELLMYPMFMVAEAETVWRQGCDFQRMLLSKLPLKNNRKHVTVYSAVHVVSKNMRPVTTFNPNRHTRGEEWHIDGYEKFSHDHFEPYEAIYLLLSGASYPTEFNAKEIIVPKGSEMATFDRNQFSAYVSRNHEQYIEGRAIENNKIYEFSNHIHRAVMPDGPEFRYTFRVRETDREDIPPVNQQQQPMNRFFDIYSQSWKNGVVQQNGAVTISYPKEWLNY